MSIRTIRSAKNQAVNTPTIIKSLVPLAFNVSAKKVFGSSSIVAIFETGSLIPGDPGQGVTQCVTFVVCNRNKHWGRNTTEESYAAYRLTCDEGRFDLSHIPTGSRSREAATLAARIQCERFDLFLNAEHTDEHISGSTVWIGTDAVRKGGSTWMVGESKRWGARIFTGRPTAGYVSGCTQGTSIEIPDTGKFAPDLAQEIGEAMFKLRDEFTSCEFDSSSIGCIGSWLDTDTQIWHIDFCRVFESEQDALACAKANGQIAIWSIHEQKEVRL